MKFLFTLIGFIASTSAFAQTATVNYFLEDVWLDPNITHPSEPPQLMTGKIAWTYTIGDFENGSGEFIALNLPWHNGQGPALAWNIEVDQVEVTMPGNWHDWGADVSIKLTPPLTLNQPAPVDLVFSKFDIEAFGTVRKGRMLSGSIVPESSFLPFCTAKTGLTCGTPAIGWTGSPSATAVSGFNVTASPARSCKSGILLYNTAMAAAPLPFQGGSLCIEPMGLRRAGPVNSGGTPGNFCDGVFSVDMNSFRAAVWTVPSCAGTPSGIPPNSPAPFLSTAGTMVHAQYWGRDSVATGSFVSDGLVWTVGP